MTIAGKLANAYYFVKGSSAYSPATPLPLSYHKGVSLQTKIPRECGAYLVKENWVIEDTNDPEHFRHFLAHIYPRTSPDPGLPVVLLVAGMLENGNHYRLSPIKDNFRGLDGPTSFANALAGRGFHVILANLRFCRWIYTRYVYKELGIRNNFSDSTDFKRLVEDLSFYLDAALAISRANSVAVGGFSMGGMLTMYYLATQSIDPRLSHAIFMASPTRFSNEQTLINLFATYGLVAKYVPLRKYGLAYLLSSNIRKFNNLLKYLPPKYVAALPLAQDLFNPEMVNPTAIYPFLKYVLEPMPPPIVDFLIDTAQRGEFLDQEGEKNIPAALHRLKAPSLVICGDRDGLVSEESNQTLLESLGSERKERRTIKDTGHLDLIAGYKFEEPVRLITDFIRT